jgi:hypothetical protein
MSSTVTVLELAKEVYRQNNWLLPGDNWSMADLDKAQLPMMGGCQVCEASIACYNAYPSKSGYLRCADCIGEEGWHSSSQAYRDIFPDGICEKKTTPAGPKMVRIVWAWDDSNRFYASSWQDVENVINESKDKGNIVAVYWPDED